MFEFKFDGCIFEEQKVQFFSAVSVGSRKHIEAFESLYVV